MRRLVWPGALAGAVLLAACGPGDDSPPVAQVPVATTLATTPVQPAASAIGEPLPLGHVVVTVLSVADPFTPGPQLQPAPGSRLVSIRYEVVGLRPDSLQPADLPALEVRDAAGRTYRSEHGRISAVDRASGPGQPAARRRLEHSALFEVPASASGLRATFRSSARPGEEAVVRLD